MLKHRFITIWIAIWLACVMCLTFAPFRFSAQMDSISSVFKLDDALSNLTLFIPIGLCYGYYKAFSFRTLLGAFLLGFGLSLCVEFTQLFIPIRTSHLSDLITNGTSALIGYLLITPLKPYLHQKLDHWQLQHWLVVTMLFCIAGIVLVKSTFVSTVNTTVMVYLGLFAIAVIVLLILEKNEATKKAIKAMGFGIGLVLFCLAISHDWPNLINGAFHTLELFTASQAAVSLVLYSVVGLALMCFFVLQFFRGFR